MLQEPISRKLLQVAKVYLGAFTKRVENLEINRYHYILLLIAEHNGQLTQKQLAEITGKDKSSMVSIIDTLSSKGYVYREVNPNDRRQQLIKITPKAEADIPTIKESFDYLNQVAIQNIDPEKLQAFEDVLQLITGNLKSLEANMVSFRLKKSKPLTRKSTS